MSLIPTIGVPADRRIVGPHPFPMMVRDDLPLEPQGNPDVDVSRASGAADADEIDAAAGWWHEPARALFVGGGTPTLLAPEHWRTILAAIGMLLTLAGNWLILSQRKNNSRRE